MEIAAYLIGVCIGVIITLMVTRGYSIGNLRVDRSDPIDGPHLFLELKEPVNSVSRRRYVILTVKNENYISQK